MTGVIVIDTNLLVLLVVGSASESYISMHKRLQHHYTIDDFRLLGLIISQFSDIILVPHILAEASNLLRHIDKPARTHVQRKFRTIIETVIELPVASAYGASREEFEELGITDAMILHLCEMQINGISTTLITADSILANRAYSLGHSVIDYRREFQQ
jgi:hypothetical protein